MERVNELFVDGLRTIPVDLLSLDITDEQRAALFVIDEYGIGSMQLLEFRISPGFRGKCEVA